MERLVLPFIATIAIAFATPAVACRTYTPSANLSVLHRQIPASISSEQFVAEVQFEDADAGWADLREGARARIVRVIQGHSVGEVLIVRDTAEVRIICYPPIRYDGHGILVGKPTGFQDGHLIVEPVFETPDEMH